jgi:hypothetical protein
MLPNNAIADRRSFGESNPRRVEAVSMREEIVIAGV